MDQHEWLADRFEENRAHLRAVAFRMLGSLSEADDAVQEAWLRLSRSDTNEIRNLGAWLTTVVARVSLDALRQRKSRREETPIVPLPEPAAIPTNAVDPEQEAMLAESVGLALLVVLEKLAPAERLAFVLHDMFAVPFEEIASITGRTPTAARQLASRARRRVHGAPALPEADLHSQRQVIDAFLAALRARDFEGLVAVLDPEVVVHGAGAVGEVHGARNFAQGAVTFSRYARFIQPALVDGSMGLVLAPNGRLSRALRMTIAEGKIVEIDIIIKPEELARLDLAVL